MEYPSLFIRFPVFSFLLKAVYEKSVLDLGPSQISSLTSFVLSELSSSVEDWCLRKGTPLIKESVLEWIKNGRNSCVNLYFIFL